MKTDFLDAHERHREDAQLLFQNQRWANADHLFGMAAECGLKCLMRVFKWIFLNLMAVMRSAGTGMFINHPVRLRLPPLRRGEFFFFVVTPAGWQNAVYNGSL